MAGLEEVPDQHRHINDAVSDSAPVLSSGLRILCPRSCNTISESFFNLSLVTDSDPSLLPSSLLPIRARRACDAFIIVRHDARLRIDIRHDFILACHDVLVFRSSSSSDHRLLV